MAINSSINSSPINYSKGVSETNISNINAEVNDDNNVQTNKNSNQSVEFLDLSKNLTNKVNEKISNVESNINNKVSNVMQQAVSFSEERATNVFVERIVKNGLDPRIFMNDGSISNNKLDLVNNWINEKIQLSYEEKQGYEMFLNTEYGATYQNYYGISTYLNSQLSQLESYNLPQKYAVDVDNIMDYESIKNSEEYKNFDVDDWNKNQIMMYDQDLLMGLDYLSIAQILNERGDTKKAESTDYLGYYNYMTDEQQKMYHYLFYTEGELTAGVYLATIYEEYQTEIAQFSELKNEIDDAIDQLPYQYLIETNKDDYNNFISNLDEYNQEQYKLYEDGYISDILSVEAIRYQNDPWDRTGNRKYYLYMTEDEQNMYHYIYSLYGDEVAQDYLSKMEDQVNMRYGYALAMERYNSLDLTDEGAIKASAANVLGVSVDGLGDGVTTWAEGLQNAFSNNDKISAEEYERMFYIQLLSENSDLYDELYSFNSCLGNMLPSMAMSYVIPATGCTGLAKYASSISMGLSAGGNAKHQALVEGADPVSANIYGFFSGASEATLERFLGGIPGLSETEGHFIKELISEGVEEGTQEYVDAILQYSILGNDINLDEVSGSAAESFIMGAVMGGVLNGASSMINVTVNNVSYELSIKQIADYMSANPDIPMDVAIRSLCNNTTSANIDAGNIDMNQVQNDVNNKINSEPISQKIVNKFNEMREQVQSSEVLQAVMNNAGSLNFDAFKKNRIDNNVNNVMNTSSSIKNNLSDSKANSTKIEEKLERYNQIMDEFKNNPNYKYWLEEIKKGHAIAPTEEFLNLRTELHKLEIDLNNFQMQNSKIDNSFEDIQFKNENIETTPIKNGGYQNSEINKNNIVDLKNEVLKTINPKWNKIEQARKAYIELNKRINYDIENKDSVSKSRFFSAVNFESMKSNNVICSEWAYLYKDVLMSLGFSENDVKVVYDSMDEISHAWVEIKLDDNNIILADATDNHFFYSADDITNCKCGDKLLGFVKTDSKYSGIKPVELCYENSEAYLNNCSSFKSMDKKIGFIKNNYFGDNVNLIDASFFKKIFNNSKIKKIQDSVAHDLLSSEIPNDMDPVDYYHYCKKLEKKFKLRVEIKNEFSRDSMGNHSKQTLLVIGNMYSSGKVFIYSKFHGKLVFDNEVDMEAYLKSKNYLIGKYR